MNATRPFPSERDTDLDSRKVLRKMDQGDDANICASGNRQSASQSSHLYHACLSVLTRQSFQKARCYSHHISLKAFMEASRMECYICSWMLSVLPESDQETLRALSEERISNNMVAVGNNVSVSDSRTMLWQALQADQSGCTWICRTCSPGWKYNVCGLLSANWGYPSI